MRQRETSNDIFQAYYAVWFRNGIKRTDLTVEEEVWIDAERERFHALAQWEQDAKAAERYFEDRVSEWEEEDDRFEYDLYEERMGPAVWHFVCRDCYDVNLRTKRWVQNRWSEYPEYYCLDCVMTKVNRDQLETDILPWSTDRSG